MMRLFCGAQNDRAHAVAQVAETSASIKCASDANPSLAARCITSLAIATRFSLVRMHAGKDAIV